ncbi:hypothetical protein BYT27DRAFT_7099823 [Phlegmacium glaucopus]|nr:hypothetical protein BYT27DRAFT_7099823 [Phlegmacium glaucopus]
MDSYPDSSFWDNTPSFTQLPGDDFLALLHKQFPPIFDTVPVGPGVDPQNLSSFSLPSLSPPSEDSSPSPPNSNQDAANEDLNEPPLKRKASGGDFSDNPNQKTQHTSLHSDKKNNGNTARRKSAGHVPKDENRLMKRKEQNRAAQRAFRERKEKHVKDLEDKISELEAKNEQAQNENENLRDLLARLRNENVVLKQSSFTFTAPKNPIKSPETADLPKFSSVSSSARSAVASPVASERPSPKMTNPLDWSSLTAFDPAMLNLLDDPVPQPTATAGAMQLDFGFGQNTGLASNAPYTTIASNPMFMSFASTFDSLSPDPSNSSAAASNTFLTSPFNFDMSTMSTWSPPPTTSQDPQLDDLFTGYLGAINSTDFSIAPQSSTSLSPVSHHVATPFRSSTSQTPSSSFSSAAPSLLDGPLPALEKEPCHTKQNCEKLISSGEPSPFATDILHRGAETATSGFPCSEGAAFPKTIKSDKNIEVLTAWKNITSDPKFKDVDIASLCTEFSKKARCDGTRVVLEPQGVHSILQNLSEKH